MSRTLEKNELVNMIGGQNFGALGNQNVYNPSQYPRPGAGGAPGYQGAPGYGVPPGYPPSQGYPPRPNYPHH